MAGNNGYPSTVDPTDWEGARVHAFRLARLFGGSGLSIRDAEDVASTVIAKVYAKRDTVRTHFTGFLATVTRREVAQFYRNAKRGPDTIPVDADALADANVKVPTPQLDSMERDPAIIVEEQATMRETLARFAAVLSPCMLRVVTLLAKGLDMRQVAERLGCTESNVRVTRWRAKKKLRAIYAEVTA